MKKRLNKFSPEVRKRAVRLVQEHLGQYLPLLFAAVFWAPLAWGLWHLQPLARKVAVVLL